MKKPIDRKKLRNLIYETENSELMSMYDDLLDKIDTLENEKEDLDVECVRLQNILYDSNRDIKDLEETIASLEDTISKQEEYINSDDCTIDRKLKQL